MILDNLIYFRTGEGSIYDIVDIYEGIKEGRQPDAEDEKRFFKALSELISESVSHGYYGNLWQLYITNMLVNHENAYSLSCEMKGDAVGSISVTAGLDFTIIYHIFNMDFMVFQPYFSYDYNSLLNFDA
ncbi:MAG: hypothetical protein HUJ70_15115, partial [Pseudobutyrivibrio sp.]|nr:hypothetical protein [Pseudobutyrivibrio sp.]MCF0186173.1 hypothetical protein [Bacteroidaceae bacterium]